MPNKDRRGRSLNLLRHQRGFINGIFHRRVTSQTFGRFKGDTSADALYAPLFPSCRNGSKSPMAEGGPNRIITH